MLSCDIYFVKKSLKFESRTSFPKSFNPAVHYSKVLFKIREAAYCEMASVDGRHSSLYKLALSYICGW